MEDKSNVNTTALNFRYWYHDDCERKKYCASRGSISVNLKCKLVTEYITPTKFDVSDPESYYVNVY